MTVAAFEALDATSTNTNKDADYIVGPYTEEDDAYKYYRIIGTTKTLISGGGSGTNNAEIVTSWPPSDPDEDTDYYRFDSALSSYRHYRYINGNLYLIGGDLYTKAEVDNKIATAQAALEGENKRYYATYKTETIEINGETQ